MRYTLLHQLSFLRRLPLELTLNKELRWQGQCWSPSWRWALELWRRRPKLGSLSLASSKVPKVSKVSEACRILPVRKSTPGSFFALCFLGSFSVQKDSSHKKIFLVFWCGVAARRELEPWPLFVLISTIRHSNQLKDWAFQAGNARKKCSELLIYAAWWRKATFGKLQQQCYCDKVWNLHSCIHLHPRLNKAWLKRDAVLRRWLQITAIHALQKRETDNWWPEIGHIQLTAAQCLASNLN